MKEKSSQDVQKPPAGWDKNVSWSYTGLLLGSQKRWRHQRVCLEASVVKESSALGQDAEVVLPQLAGDLHLEKPPLPGLSSFEPSGTQRTSLVQKTQTNKSCTTVPLNKWRPQLPSLLFLSLPSLTPLFDSPTERIITLRITSERITSERINTERITSERINLNV
jgi:hypothetical protein